MSSEVITGDKIVEFILKHKNGGQQVFDIIADAADAGTIQAHERADCLLFVYQDMSMEDSFFNREGKCDTVMHTNACINMFLVARDKLGLYR